METLSFAFGMLAMIAVALVTAVVVGMVKVLKMKKDIVLLGQWMERSDDSLNRRISNEAENHNKNLKEVYRVIEDDRRELNQRIDEVYRYTDSRFDKMENKFTMGHKTSKQIIND